MTEAIKKVTEATKLTNSLAPTQQEQLDGKRSIHIELDPTNPDKDKRTVTTFIGFWDGRFIKIALREIERAYMYRRHNQLYNSHK